MNRMSMMLAIVVGTAARAAPPASTPALLEKGKASYATYCLSCHGATGEGNGPAGMYLVPKPRNLVTEPFKKGNKPEEVFQTLTTGLPGSTMMPFPQLPEEERWALTYYVLGLQQKAKPAPPKSTAKKGKK